MAYQLSIITSSFMNQPKIKPNQFINSKSFCLICLSSTLIHPSYPRDFVGGSPSLCKGNHRRRHNWTHHDRGSPTHLWPESLEFIMVVMMVMVVQDELRVKRASCLGKAMVVQQNYVILYEAVHPRDLSSTRTSKVDDWRCWTPAVVNFRNLNPSFGILWLCFLASGSFTNLQSNRVFLMCFCRFLLSFVTSMGRDSTQQEFLLEIVDHVAIYYSLQPTLASS